jgi:hypothetical protein
MPQFSLNNGLISRDNSTITGSLNVSGQITASHFGTASYVISSSYSFNSGTASYTATTNVLSASYATTTTSASIAQTASIMLNPSYGPTQGIGVITPNIVILSSVVATGLAIFTASLGTGANLNGTWMFPFMVNRDCTLVTMSLLGAAQGTPTTCSIGIYSNSNTTSLPEYLLVTGSIRVAIASATVLLYNSIDFTPIQLYANNVYWVAHTSNAAGAFYAWRPAQFSAFTCPSYNPLLGYAISTSGSGSPINFAYPMWCIRSGSFGTTLAATASQATSSYFPPTGSYGGNFGVQCVAPYLRVTYP